MCTFSCALFQTWNVPSKCLSLSLSLSVCLSLSLSHYSTSSCQIYLRRVESILDNGFHSLTLHSPRWSTSWTESNPHCFTQDSSRLCRWHGCHLYDLCLRCDSALVFCTASIASASALNLQEQTAVYCSAGDRVKISNRLIPQRDDSVAITVIHQKKCSVGRDRAALSIFHQTISVIKSKAEVRRSQSE